MEQRIDILWLIICSALVFLMQGGFLALEAGLTRSKNNINVAVKNLIDFGITAVLFWAMGFAFMFGTSVGGFVGLTLFAPDFSVNQAQLMVFLLFQIMFCGTATTIISGAVAERVRFGGYVIIAILIAGIIYPVFGHWAWNGINVNEATGWLGASGFVDFAGSTVVHSIGGWASLAILLIIGARAGRFLPDGTVQKIPGANIPLSALGVLLLWLGWFGFNGGSLLRLDEQVIKIVLNTILAGAAGLVAGLILSWLTKGFSAVDGLMNGSLAGLVAITAGAHAVSIPAAVLIGMIGAAVMLWVTTLLEQWRIDDAVGAIPVHLGAGIWGTLAVGIFGQPELLGTGLDRIPQIGIQAVGIVVAGAWAFGVTYIVLNITNRISPLRVSVDDEQIGLNVSEHDVSTELLDFMVVLDQQARTGDLTIRAPEEPFTEVGQIAHRYNQVLDALQEATARAEAIIRVAADGIITFAQNTLEITSVNPMASQIFGYYDDELLGQPLTTLLAPDKTGGVMLPPEDVHRIISQQIETNPTFDLHGRRSNGQIFEMEVIITKAIVGNEVFYAGTFRPR